jgi:hypothetical protein
MRNLIKRSLAGAEPANDLRRRIVAAFEEVGLEVKESRALVPNKMDAWCVYATAPAPFIPPYYATILVDAFVSRAGDLIQLPHLHATIGEAESGRYRLLDGREAVLPTDLVRELQQTLDEIRLLASHDDLLTGRSKHFLGGTWRLADPISRLPC